MRRQNFATAAGDDGLASWRSASRVDPGLRPHGHATGQFLYVVGGSGFVVFPGAEEQRVSEGGLVVVPAGNVRMHGASDEEPICQLAIRCPGRTDWHRHVADEWRQFVSSLRN